MFLASKTCYWEQSWRLLRNRLWNMIWGVDHSTLQTKPSSFFIIRGNPVLTTGSSSLRPVFWKWHEQKFMCRNNISKLTLFKKVRLITPKLQVRLITPPDAIYKHVSLKDRWVVALFFFVVIFLNFLYNSWSKSLIKIGESHRDATCLSLLQAIKTNSTFDL